MSDTADTAACLSVPIFFGGHFSDFPCLFVNLFSKIFVGLSFGRVLEIVAEFGRGSRGKREFRPLRNSTDVERWRMEFKSQSLQCAGNAKIVERRSALNIKLVAK